MICSYSLVPTKVQFLVPTKVLKKGRTTMNFNFFMIWRILKYQNTAVKFLYFLYADSSKKTLLHRVSNVTRFRLICDAFPSHM